jgi:hypothetical protein
MEEDSKFLDDDYFYLLDFEEELEHAIEMEEILEGPIGSTSGFASTSTFDETYFNISDYESEYKGNEGSDGEW